MARCPVEVETPNVFKDLDDPADKGWTPGCVSWRCDLDEGHDGLHEAGRKSPDGKWNFVHLARKSDR